MQLAINYSPQAAELQQAGTICVDRFKCPNWEWLIEEAQNDLPVYVHTDLIAGNGSLAQSDWNAIESLLLKTETPYLNLHLMPTLQAFGYSSEPVSRAQGERVIEQMVSDVALAVYRVGAERVIVENIPYRFRNKRGRQEIRACIEPDIFTRVLQATGAGFLFDLSHARISSSALGMSEKTYIEALPLSRIREIHVTGIRMVDGERRDHFELLPDDWVMFEWFMSKIRAGEATEPWIVAFEYGGVGERFEWRSDSAVIGEQVPQLRQIMQKTG